MLVSLQDKGDFAHAAKCASRTLIGWAACASNPLLYTEKPYLFTSSRLGLEYAELKSYIKVIDRKGDYIHNGLPPMIGDFRLAILRDPVKRFVSGFVNRVVFHRKIPLMSISAFIEDFDNVSRHSSDIREHFKSQVHFYGMEPSAFTHLFPIKEMEEVRQFLSERLSVSLPPLHMQQSGSFTAPTLSAKEVEWIKKRYSIDYDVFGERLKGAG